MKIIQFVLLLCISNLALADNTYKRIPIISKQEIINFKDTRKLELYDFSDLDLCLRTAQEFTENQINSIPPENRNTDNILRVKINVKRYITKGFPKQDIDKCNVGALITINEFKNERAYIAFMAK